MKILIAALLLATGTSFADITSDLESAHSLYDGTNYAAAHDAYEAVIVNYPNANTNLLVDTQLRVAYSSLFEGESARAEAEFGKVLTDYPNAGVDQLLAARYHIGDSLARQGKYAEAQVEFEQALIDYPLAQNGALADTRLQLGHSLRLQGDKAGANAAYIEAAIGYGFVHLAHQERCYNHLDFVTLGTEATIAHLKNLLLVTEAVEVNTEFLGRIKSQLSIFE